MAAPYPVGPRSSHLCGVCEQGIATLGGVNPFHAGGGASRALRVDGAMEQPRPSLRLSLTLPGGASLGAYQAGAVAALLVAVQELRRRGGAVVVDALGGASSGSLVALFAAQCLLEGLDPDAVLHRAWVERVTLDLLPATDPAAPSPTTACATGSAKCSTRTTSTDDRFSGCRAAIRHGLPSTSA